MWGCVNSVTRPPLFGVGSRYYSRLECRIIYISVQCRMKLRVWGFGFRFRVCTATHCHVGTGRGPAYHALPRVLQHRDGLPHVES